MPWWRASPPIPALEREPRDVHENCYRLQENRVCVLAATRRTPLCLKHLPASGHSANPAGSPRSARSSTQTCRRQHIEGIGLQRTGLSAFPGPSHHYADVLRRQDVEGIGRLTRLSSIKLRQAGFTLAATARVAAALGA